MTDSLTNYFLRIVYRPVPINALVPLFLLGALATNGIGYLVPKPKYLAAILLGVFGYVLAIVFAGENMWRLMEIATAIAAFIVGYALFKHTTSEGAVIKLMLLLSLAYGITCLMSLHKYFPALFPVKTYLWSLNGKLIDRPEVTTNSNFEVLYLMSAIPLLSLPIKPTRLLLAFVATALAADTLIALQTRSGILVLIGLVLFATLVPIWQRQLGRSKILIIPVLGIIGILLALPILIKQGAAIWARFTEAGYATGEGRWQSFMYLFEKLPNPAWWIPRGNDEFIARTGDLPHSNITAHFVDGGMPGLVSWILLVPVPLYHLLKKFFKRRLDTVSCLVLQMGLGMFIIQMSLNIPFFDQIWLWTGAVAGTLDKLTPSKVSVIPAPYFDQV
jgi:hypothetical protein